MLPVRTPVRATVLATLLALALPAAAQQVTPDTQQATERWYEILRSGKKVGYTSVTWAPSTWKGKKTVHDRTTVIRRTIRNMAGIQDVFETSLVLDLERGEDGTLWWMKSVYTEGSRVTSDELTWTEPGYAQVIKVGDEPEQKRVYALDAPVMTDAEAFLSAKVRAGAVKVGETYSVRLLDERKRSAVEHPVKIVAAEKVEGHAGPVDTLRVVETAPESRSSTTYWLDSAGAFVRIRGDGGSAYRRVARATAEDMPVQPPSFSVTTPSFPPLERIFSARKVKLDLHLQGDADRSLPEIPESPWSRTVARRGSDEEGWVYEMELAAYDKPDASGKLPVDPVAFKEDLEATPLMPSDHPKLKAKAREVIGGETNLRAAAYKLARYVHGTLTKRSPEIASTTALEILEQGMGDCSEHCVLFVTLCRAAGIPARRCSGYVNIGTMWGAHAWAEIWVGDQWTGADPTTGEVGTQARYVFFGYPDRAGSFPGVVSSRAEGRMRFVATELEEGGRTYDLRSPERHRVHDKSAGRYTHALAGIELKDVPPDWDVRLTGNGFASITAPGMSATIRISADQGYDLGRFGGANGTYGRATARVMMSGSRGFVYAHSRRRLIQMTVQGGSQVQKLTLERVLLDTFRPVLGPVEAPKTAPATPSVDPAPGKDDLPPLDED